MCFILTEAIAAFLVCHQRNAIFGRGTCIFVLTRFLCAKRNAPHQVRRKNVGERDRESENSFPLKESRANDAVADDSSMASSFETREDALLRMRSQNARKSGIFSVSFQALGPRSRPHGEERFFARLEP
jgi:hypothetical protein